MWLVDLLDLPDVQSISQAALHHPDFILAIDNFDDAVYEESFEKPANGINFLLNAWEDEASYRGGFIDQIALREGGDPVISLNRVQTPERQLQVFAHREVRPQE